MYNAKEALSSDIVYSGTVTWHKNRYWNVRLMKCGQIISNKAFAKTYYGPEGQEVAEAFRRSESDLHGLTLRRCIPPKAVREYIAGFIDGDGCFSVSKGGAIDHVTISQAQDLGTPQVLLFIQKWYGGILETPRKRKSTRRVTHTLSIRGPHAIWLTKDFIDVGILKQEQASECLRLRATGKADRARIVSNLARIKKIENMQSMKFDPDDPRMTWAYIAGLFDAEGCVRFKGSAYMQISQLSNKSILECIKHKLGRSGLTINEGKLMVYAVGAVLFARKIAPYSITKLEQLNHLLFLHALQTYSVIPYYSVFNELCAKLGDMKRI